MERYFVLKHGSREVFGTALKVDTEAKLEERVKPMYGSLPCSLRKSEGNSAYYNVDVNGDDPAKTRLIVSLKLFGQGNLELSKIPKGAAVFLDEITQREAKELTEDAKNWDLQYMWALS